MANKFYLTVTENGDLKDPTGFTVASIIDPTSSKCELVNSIINESIIIWLDYEFNEHLVIKIRGIEDIIIKFTGYVELLSRCNDLIKCSTYYDDIRRYMKACLNIIQVKYGDSTNR